MTAGTKPKPLEIRPESIPAELRALDRWVCWSYAWQPGKNGRDGKWTKVPKQLSGTKASSTDPATWTTFDSAQRTAQFSPNFDGIGFVLVDDDDLAGVDLAHCVTECGRHSHEGREAPGTGTQATTGPVKHRSYLRLLLQARGSARKLAARPSDLVPRVRAWGTSASLPKRPADRSRRAAGLETWGKASGGRLGLGGFASQPVGPLLDPSMR